MKIKKSNTWIDKVIVLIEKECALYDTRTPQEKKKNPHMQGKCYMNDIMSEIEKGIKIAEQIANYKGFYEGQKAMSDNIKKQGL